MTIETTIAMSDTLEGQALIANTLRPGVNKDGKPVSHNGFAQLVKPGGMTVNSRLDVREWQRLDASVTEMVRTRLTGVMDLRNAGLVETGIDYGIQVLQERVQSERRLADVTMETETRVDRDRADRKTIDVPLPVISTAYQIGERELRSSRRLGAPLDVTEASESARSVAETLESMLFNGNTDVVIDGASIKGYLNATGALTDTANNVDGGDFATADNAYSTVKGTIAALDARRYYGPFMVYLHRTQYYQCLTLRDNTDTTQLDLIMRLPQVAGVKISEHNADGTMVMVQMTRDVVELKEAFGIQNREWMRGDDTVFYARVLTISVPFVKYNYNSQTGIAVITGC